MRKRVTSGFKKLMYIYGGIILVLIISCIVIYTIYNNKIKEATRQSLLAAEKMTELVPNSNVLEQASSEISKTIEEAIEETNEIEDEIKVEANENVVTETNTNPEIENITEPVVEEVVKKELVFAYPVEGEIIKPFSIDNLVFSETLQEWIVHKGIDITAPRTSVVKAAEEGIIKAIKNDPRYGLTIIIEHIDGYKTIYSNLLTTEFVTEGENVSKGQSIGTVGNSAAFEIADEPHLHFELLKDEENLDPTLYLK